MQTCILSTQFRRRRRNQPFLLLTGTLKNKFVPLREMRNSRELRKSLNYWICLHLRRNCITTSEWASFHGRDCSRREGWCCEVLISLCTFESETSLWHTFYSRHRKWRCEKEDCSIARDGISQSVRKKCTLSCLFWVLSALYNAHSTAKSVSVYNEYMTNIFTLLLIPVFKEVMIYVKKNKKPVWVWRRDRNLWAENWNLLG